MLTTSTHPNEPTDPERGFFLVFFDSTPYKSMSHILNLQVLRVYIVQISFLEENIYMEDTGKNDCIVTKSTHNGHVSTWRNYE